MIRRMLFLAALVLALPACGDNGTEAEASFAGTYTLQTIDGHALPFTGEEEVVTSGSLILRADKTWTVTFTAHDASGDASFTDGGTYTISGNSITLLSSEDNDNPVSGTFSGSTLTITDSVDATVYIFKKS